MVSIFSAASGACRLTRDLLDFTKARLGGGFPINAVPLDLHDLARKVLREAELAHPGREFHLRPGTDGQGTWDGDRLTQLLTNLARNAARYGEARTPVTVRTAAEGELLVLQVHNWCRPIPEALRARLFEPLQRGTLEVDPSGRSVGLGLFIAKHIAERHEGTISVSSTAAEGTTFTVRLPRALTGP